MGLLNQGQSRIVWLGPLNISICATSLKWKWVSLNWILKKKTFDKTEHKLMLQVMKHNGFGPMWLHWMEMIFDSATSSVRGTRKSILLQKEG
jgi:hypothetical protein